MAEGCVSQERESDMGGPQFSPPLYKQRYEAVLKACRQIKAAKVVDIGCAECKLLRLLSREDCVCELIGVDIQGSILEAQCNRLQPLITDYVLPRDKPLTIHLMQGSIAEADQRLMDFDLLSCVEVIEHLDPPVLERVPGTIFGTLQPEMVIITTPNSEFNVLFPHFHGFRHPDHRFEWTRKQFQIWCKDICIQYPHYTVEYSGVGQPPSVSDHVGYCSQMATFTRIHTVQRDSKYGSPYKTIMECNYPHHQPLPKSQRLRHEVEFRLLRLLKYEEEKDEHNDVISIKLDKLLEYKQISDLCTSVEDIRMALVGSTVVQRIERDEVLFDRQHSESSSDDDDNVTTTCRRLVADEHSETENWD